MKEATADRSYSFCQLGRRANQEDARYPDTDTVDGDARVFIVCDGVGGMADGEVASRTVAQALGEYVSRTDLTQPFTRDDMARALAQAYRALDRAAGGRDMATTLTFVCLHGGGLMAAHIGDSRIYHIRPGVGIRYRSNDHSLVNDLVRTGNLTPEQAAHDPRGNYITRCMQSGQTASGQAAATVMQTTDLHDGDYLFLCTDGVLHKLSEETLLAILEPGDDSPYPTDQARMQAIADLCADSSDNNTAYLIPIRLTDTGDPALDPTDDEDDDTSAVTRPLTESSTDLTVDVRPESPSLIASIVDFFRN